MTRHQATIPPDPKIKIDIQFRRPLRSQWVDGAHGTKSVAALWNETVSLSKFGSRNSLRYIPVRAWQQLSLGAPTIPCWKLFPCALGSVLFLASNAYSAAENPADDDLFVRPRPTLDVRRILRAEFQPPRRPVSAALSKPWLAFPIT